MSCYWIYNIWNLLIYWLWLGEGQFTIRPIPVWIWNGERFGWTVFNGSDVTSCLLSRYITIKWTKHKRKNYYDIAFCLHFLFNMYKWNGKYLLLKSGLLTLSFGACSYKDFSRLDFNRYVFKLNHVYSKIIIHIVMVFKVKRSCLICLWSIKHTRRGELNKVTILEV